MPQISRRADITLWTVQTVLALLFIFAGGSKLLLPVAAMQQGPLELPGAFLRTIGVLELAGGLGLVLPGLFRVYQLLTPLAACGLMGVMAGASVVSVIAMGAATAILPVIVGALAYVVFAGRGGRTVTFGRHARA